jgi:hypothetical protein
LSEDLKTQNGLEDLNTVKVKINNGSSMTFQNDPKSTQHKVILDDDPTKVETISHENNYGVVAYIYRFEQFAKDKGFLCHQDHHARYFKPSDAK